MVFSKRNGPDPLWGLGSTVIINADDVLLSAQAGRKKIFKIITYGIKAKADCQAVELRTDIVSGRYLNFQVDGKIIELNSCGINNVYNALAAICCGVFFKVPSRTLPGRLNLLNFPRDAGRSSAWAAGG